MFGTAGTFAEHLVVTFLVHSAVAHYTHTHTYIHTVFSEVAEHTDTRVNQTVYK